MFVSVFGVLLHFLYEWTNESVFAAPFSAVNESTFEHMKLLYFPLLAFAFIELKFTGKDREIYWGIKLVSTLTGLILIPVIFYTYKGALGGSAEWFYVAIFFIAAAVTFLVEYLLSKNEASFCLSENVSFLLFCLVGVLFVLFTFFTPRIPLFLDPVTNTYGI